VFFVAKNLDNIIQYTKFTVHVTTTQLHMLFAIFYITYMIMHGGTLLVPLPIIKLLIKFKEAYVDVD
jgi:hypothetical protein